MTLENERSASLMQAQFRALHAVMAKPEGQTFNHGQFLTQLMRHGGLYTLMDRDMMTARLVPLLSSSADVTAEAATQFVSSMGSLISSFFQHLHPTSFYVIDSSLVSHICYPGPDASGKPRGVTFTLDTPTNPAEEESKFIPAAFTFIGQFIDHDLTMNAVNLFDPQVDPVLDTASPYIDLDSVYGPRTKLFNLPADGSLMNGDGTFKLQQVSNGPGGNYFYDMVRDPVTHKAYISDARNDENQLVLQIHILVMRLHNKLITEVFKTGDLKKRLTETHTEVLYLWQSMIIDDFLAKVLREDVRTTLLTEIAKDSPKFGKFVYKPYLNLSTNKYEVSLPHEFAIGFRMGHSMLKPRYLLQADATKAVTLFDNSLSPTDGQFDDLRGSQPLVGEHVIDLKFFASDFYSNVIDAKVTSVVFDLPESTIPDDIKFIGNLIQRNLVRSTQVGLCCGEDLAAQYGKHYKGVDEPGVDHLKPVDIESDVEAQKLFVAKDANGNIRMKDGKELFQTPLWYYLLKDAEKNGTTRESLGKLGSYLIGEVILGAIAWADVSVLKDGKRNMVWTPAIPVAEAGKVTFLDLVGYVG